MNTVRFVVAALVALAMAQAAQGQAVPTPAKTMPSTRLRQMIDTTMERIASLTDNPQQPDRTALAAAQSEWAALSVTAPPPERPTYAAAANTARALLGAVDEYNKAVADFKYSSNTHGPQDRQNLDISNGRQRPGTASSNVAKQNKGNADTRDELLRKEEFMSRGVTQRWKVRTAQIGTILEQTYTVELVTEKRMLAARGAAPALPPVQAPTEATPSQIYSPAGSWATPHGTWTLTDDGKITAPDAKGTWQWSDRTKRELEFQWPQSGKSGKGIFATDGRTLEVIMPDGGHATLTR